MRLASKLLHRVDGLRTIARTRPAEARGALFVARRALQRVQAHRSLDGLLEEVLDSVPAEDADSARSEWERISTWQ